MESRPYFNKSTAEIEEIYKRNIDNIAILNELLRELHHREKPKAVQLREEIASVLNNKKQTNAFTISDRPKSVAPKPTPPQIQRSPEVKPAVHEQPDPRSVAPPEV